MAPRRVACAALAIVALAGVAQAAIHFPNVPFPFSDKEKHSVLTIKHAIVGEGHLLSTNAGERNICRRANRRVNGARFFG